MPELFTGDTMTAAMNGESAVLPSDASPASDPSTTAADVSSAQVTATTAPAVTDGSTETPASDSTTTDTTTTGVPPEERWPQILSNARTKAADEVKAQYAWAERIPEQHRSTVSEFYQTLDAEPVQAIEALMATAANDPIHAPQLRSLLGRLLRGGTTESATPQATAPKAAALPEPDFQDEQGNQFYSAARMREFGDVLEARIDAKLRPTIEPLTNDLQTRAARAERAKQQKAADDWAAKRYETVSQWDGFKAHEKEIAAALAADPSLEIGDAYVQVVVPKLSQVARKEVVSQQHTKVAASSVNPSNPASAVQRPPRDFAEGLRQMGVGA